jgi:hypothetical protein
MEYFCKRAGSAGSLSGDIAASYFSKANCQSLSNVFVLSSRRRR